MITYETLDIEVESFGYLVSKFGNPELLPLTSDLWWLVHRLNDSLRTQIQLEEKNGDW